MADPGTVRGSAIIRASCSLERSPACPAVSTAEGSRPLGLPPRVPSPSLRFRLTLPADLIGHVHGLTIGLRAISQPMAGSTRPKNLDEALVSGRLGSGETSMKTAIIQISDIHIRCTPNLVVSPTENPVLHRAAEVARAVNSVCYGVQHRIIIVSGDMAFSGKEEEYQQARTLIESIRTQLATSIARSRIPVLMVAGNHDCDFSLSRSVRRIVLDSFKPDEIDDDIIAQFTDIQRPYFGFVGHFDASAAGTLPTGVDRLYSQAVIEQGGKTIVFHLFNSASMSQLHEKPGGLYFPIRSVKARVAAAPAADIAVAVIHHPFNWYSPENARELRSFLEDNADLILTGHEHVPVPMRREPTPENRMNTLREGVLQETSQPDTSSFNVVIFDTEQGRQQTHRFLWVGDHYVSQGESYWRPFKRNKRLTRKQFTFTDAFSQWIEDAGARSLEFQNS